MEKNKSKMYKAEKNKTRCTKQRRIKKVEKPSLMTIELSLVVKNLNCLKISDEIVTALFIKEHFSKILNVWPTKLR